MVVVNVNFIKVLCMSLMLALPSGAAIAKPENSKRFMEKCKADADYRRRLRFSLNKAELIPIHFWSAPPMKFPVGNTLEFECRRLKFKLIKISEYIKKRYDKNTRIFDGSPEHPSPGLSVYAYEFLKFFDDEQIEKYKNHSKTKESFRAFATGRERDGLEIAINRVYRYKGKFERYRRHYGDEHLYYLAVLIYIKNHKCHFCSQDFGVSALDVFAMAAKQGNHKAALMVANYYASRYIYKDLGKSYAYIDIARKAGSQAAELFQSLMLLHGVGVDKDPEKAKRIFQAYTGAKDAHYFVTRGVFEEVNNPTKKGKAKAKSYYLSALNVEEGFNPYRLSMDVSKEALFRLGILHVEEGKYKAGVNMIEASALFGNRKAAYYLGIILQNSKLSKLYGAHTRQIAYMWMVAAADARYVPAAYDLAILDTKVFDYDLQGLDQARRHIELARDADYLDAKKLAGQLYDAYRRRADQVKASKLTFGKVMMGLLAAGVLEGLENGFNWDALGGSNSGTLNLDQHHTNVMVSAYWLSLN